MLTYAGHGGMVIEEQVRQEHVKQRQQGQQQQHVKAEPNQPLLALLVQKYKY
jgi:hypothetical protein